MRRILALGMLAIGGCLDPVAYPCAAVTQCIADGKDGACHASGWCVYPDGECPSGQRFGPAAGDGLADDCVEVDTGGGSVGATSSASSSAGETADGCGPCDMPPGPCFAAEASCDGGTCSYVPIEMGMACEDEDPCTRDTTCDGDGECVAGETIVCDDPPLDSPCRANPGTCEDDGSCTYDLLPAGADCEDGDPCTTGDQCTTMGACAAGEICGAKDICSTGGVCMDGACVFTPAADGTSCGVNPADRCCAGTCVDVSTDAAHCGGCGAACTSGEVCESVADTPECDPHPVSSSGRCTCNGDDLDCPPGQVCRTLTPIANRCAPDANADCHSGMFVDVQDCPNYCSYPSD